MYVAQLQHVGGLLGFVHRQLGLPISSTAPLGKITDAFSGGMRRLARKQRVPWVNFGKGQRKDDVMHEHLARFTGTEGVLFTQEKTLLCRTECRRDENGDAYPWIVKTTVFIVLVAIGVDLLFALDSIPAVFRVTRQAVPQGTTARVHAGSLRG